MSKNKKTIESFIQEGHQAIQHLGFAVMALAAVASMVDLPGRPQGKLAVVGQPAAMSNLSAIYDNSLRREREDSAPHYISYEVSQRTPARSKPMS